MSKYSVKKPFTILVAVIIVIALGVVSVTRVTTDLLPPIAIPYVMVITAYPGASPEKVEAQVSEPLERALGTVSGVKNVNSVNSENASIVQLEFSDGINMDKASLDISNALQQVTLPDGAMKPSMLELSMDMIATMYVGVSRENSDIYELSEFVKNDVITHIERVDGVANVAPLGLVEKTVQVELNPEKIREVNDRILMNVNEELEKAKEQLDEAKDLVKKGQEELEKQEAAFGSTVSEGIFSGITDQVTKMTPEIRRRIAELASRIASLRAALEQIEDIADDLPSSIPTIDPSLIPSGIPSGIPSDIPSGIPSVIPSGIPSGIPSVIPSGIPSGIPSVTPSDTPSSIPTATPTEVPTGTPTSSPTSEPTSEPTAEPTAEPTETEEPAVTETPVPTAEPTEEPVPTQAVIPPATGAGANFGYTGTAAASNGGFVRASASSAPGGTGGFVRTTAPSGTNAAGGFVRTSSPSGPSGDGTSENTPAATAVPTSSPAPTQVPGNNGNPSLADVAAQLGQIIDMLNAAAQGGSNQSISDLLAMVTQASAAMAQLSDVLPRILQNDSTGRMSEQVKEIEKALAQLKSGIDAVPGALSGLQQGFGALTQAQLTAAIAFSTAAGQLMDAQKQLDMAQAQYDSAKETALKNANLDALLTTSTLSGMIYAQNFSMPAGYIDDKEDNSWLLKVGDEFDAPDSIADALLADIDGIGTIRLMDVADVTVIDNAGLSYANLNGKDGILLSVYKGSTAGTNEVSERCKEALAEIEEEYPGTDTVVLVDQGDYITLIIRSILQSMMLGALLAVIILALFLRDIRPTIVVAISIPLSVLFAIVLMYFSDLSVNMMTLSGLALGIGMLVDNSIVVMENIFRLRNRGLSAPHAAVQGAKQVVGPILSSTLTTVCVFLPMVFTSGTVRELLVPMALSITYCLTASLIVALTVVPASASTLLRNVKTKQNKFFGKILDWYGASLAFCLKVKIVPLFIAIVLLAVCIWDVLRTGIVMLPEMTANNIEVDIYTEDGLLREESYAQADEVMNTILTVDGVADVGIMDYASTAALFTSAASGGSDNYGGYMCFIAVDEGLDENGIRRVVEEIKEKTEPLPCTVNVTTAAMGDLSSFTESGMSVRVYGRDTEKMKEISDHIGEILESQGGFRDISNGIQEGEKVLHLVIDKDQAMKYGLTVAGVYAEIAKRLTTSVKSTTVTLDGVEMDVVIVDGTDPLTKENLMDMEFKPSSQMSSAGGMASMMGGSGGDMASMMGGSGGDMASMMGGSGSGDMSALFGGEGEDGEGSGLGSLFGALTGSDDEEEEDSPEEENAEEGAEEENE